MSSNQVRRAVVTARRTIKLVHRARSELKRGEVRIAVEQCGISGEDIDLWAGVTTQPRSAPLGHEFAGWVSEVAGPSKLRIGHRVTAWVPRADACAEEVVVRGVHCCRIDDDAPYPFAVEPLARVLNMMDRVGPLAGAHTVVVGAGFLAMLTTMLTYNPGSLTVAADRPEARELARYMRASHVAHPRDLEALVRKVTKGSGAHVVYEFTGGQAGLDKAVRAVGPGGTLVIAGSHERLESRRELRPGERMLKLGQLKRMGVDLVNAHASSSQAHAQGAKHARRLLEQGVIDPGALGEKNGVPNLVPRLGEVVTALGKASMGAGEEVVVIGGGVKALMAVRLINATLDPAKLILVTLRRETHELARSLGATSVVEPANLGSALRDLADPEGAGIVFEFTGAQEGLDLGTQAVCAGGKLVIAGSHDTRADLDPTLRAGERVLDLGHLTRTGVDLVNVHFRDSEAILRGMRQAARLLGERQVDLSPLIGRRFPLARVGTAFEEAARGTRKVVVTNRSALDLPPAG